MLFRSQAVAVVLPAAPAVDLSPARARDRAVGAVLAKSRPLLALPRVRALSYALVAVRAAGAVRVAMAGAIPRLLGHAMVRVGVVDARPCRLAVRTLPAILILSVFALALLSGSPEEC